jgi:DNA-binding response OmpR family regulator
MTQMTQMSSAMIENARLRAVIAEQDETIRQLREAIVPQTVLPKRLGLTRQEHRLVMALVAAPEKVASQSFLMQALYQHDADAPFQKIVKVLVCKARKKLGRFGFEIETRWGIGYSISRQHAAALLALPETGGEN